MDQETIRSLTTRFQSMMATRNRTRAADSAITSSSPDAPQAASFRRHPSYNELILLSHHVDRYDEPGLLDRALDAMDLAKLYEEADHSQESDQSLGYQDHLIKALLKWFKEEFFQWINAPSCSSCGSETEGLGSCAPDSSEQQNGAGRVELYRCKTNQTHVERFPRYDSPGKLLTWRKGRCGEFANCFTLLCIALGSRARWVYNYEDHVWTEVYSTKLQRWVHCDACENAWDSPLIYAVGWGKKMSHCVAFSSSGAQDVSRRYIREASQRLASKVPGEVMDTAIRDINQRLRSLVTQEERSLYIKEDTAELAELEGLMHRPTATVNTSETHARESGSTSWKEERGENGPTK
ncbi:Peptide-N(4)-(N-acetyl-beta-glucosaminyl)asparagine amidase [Taphrina deformans PYCC 5710]|uniref:Peptide-N(4)-(N-acetyl-beta-glucosaminyl)asparagine amidase n=1 Tax=Taphrina deformans (strain PYCC 5710 / ATCC 11124 / CBS 356.35 / IMI 108563 / JCM 9778 / NBRC 8474) TaxID=1097556 RepID=R4X8F2_TAPDE|nr:Peptide-N(4)-(N-acetyl-beta-glucosaminyl)asparagine amidase [Taphrina deformans PYCC 5710]|eukprot:CCG81868.1 Peptide-N(4)-(N-acetyl-beta-glucosaminyl)asparagine amidase [Taphrina deformans PYCC 5710]